MSLLPLDFPELNRDQLSCCELREDALENWLQTLPLAHPLASQALLLELVSELNQLKGLAALRRLKWLEHLSKTAKQVCQELDQGSQAEQQGQAAQDLTQHLTQGYKRCLNDLLESRDQLPKNFLGPALLHCYYQALVLTGDLVRRSCELSVTTPEKTWHELYLLYRLACQSKLQQRPVQKQPPINCEQAYYQVLLLGLIEADNLRQDEVEQLYPFLAKWTSYLEIVPAKAPEASFQILASQGFKPVRHHTSHPVNSEHDFGINATAELSDELNRLLENPEHPLSKRLTQHLQALLNENAERNAPRLNTSGPVELVLGMRSVHYHLSGRQPFEQLVAGSNLSIKEKTNPFLQQGSSEDPWGKAHDAAENKSYGHLQVVDIDTADLSTSITDALDKRHPIYQLQQVNTSATGYCLAWPGEAPANLTTGELIAIKETEQTPWQPAVVRWVRSTPEGHQLGVELLPSRMQPCAIKPIIKKGDPVDFMPGFILPELKIVGTPASVLTPLLPFREGHKVVITQPGRQQRAHLVQLLSNSGQFNQFQLELLGQENALNLV